MFLVLTPMADDLIRTVGVKQHMYENAPGWLYVAGEKKFLESYVS